MLPATAALLLFFVHHSFVYSLHHSFTLQIFFDPAFHFPHSSIIFLLFICSPSPQSSGVSCQDARKLWFTYLCLCPLAIMVELRQRAQQGLCQCRKLVCHQDAWMHILTEYWMSVCGVTYKTCTVWCLVCVLHTSFTLYRVMLSYTEIIAQFLSIPFLYMHCMGSHCVVPTNRKPTFTLLSPHFWSPPTCEENFCSLHDLSENLYKYYLPGASTNKINMSGETQPTQ